MQTPDQYIAKCFLALHIYFFFLPRKDPSLSNYGKYIKQVFVYSKNLLRYSEDTLTEKLKDQVVVKVERIKKKIDGIQTHTPSLIKSFHAKVLPLILREASLRLPVQPYSRSPVNSVPVMPINAPLLHLSKRLRTTWSAARQRQLH